MIERTWNFPAQILRTIDGDTQWFRFDCGFRVYTEHSIRLWGVNTPELDTQAGKDARAFSIAWFAAHSHGEAFPYVLKTDKTRQTFNRYIATIQCSTDGASLGDDLIAAGHGVAI